LRRLKIIVGWVKVNTLHTVLIVQRKKSNLAHDPSTHFIHLKKTELKKKTKISRDVKMLVTNIEMKNRKKAKIVKDLNVWVRKREMKLKRSRWPWGSEGVRNREMKLKRICSPWCSLWVRKRDEAEDYLEAMVFCVTEKERE